MSDDLSKRNKLYTNLLFSDYIIQTRHALSKTSRIPDAIDINAPFELIPASPRSGVLLVHGLLESCFITRDIAHALYLQNHWIRSVLLPGHGSHPEQLLTQDHQEWLDTVEYGVESFPPEVQDIFILGISTGAILAVLTALKNHPKIRGIILIAPAFKINSMFDFATGWHRAISKKLKRAAWLNISPEIDYAKYCSLTFNAAYQVYLLTKKVNNALPCPSLFIVSGDDSIVSTKKTLHYFQSLKASSRQMIYYSGKPIVFKDSRIIVRNSFFPEQNILNLSHIAIPVSPQNSHYGTQGDYIFASRVGDETGFIYCELNQSQRLFYNMLYRTKSIKNPRRRLTFNPDFEFMVDKIQQFINKILDHP